MKLAITNDHGGVELKQAIKAAFPEIDWLDLGANSEDRVDYPDFANDLAARINSGEIDSAVAICGSGVGICMALNRHAHIRAAQVAETVTARLCREHNNANVICFGGRLIGPVLAIECIKTFIATEFLGGRYGERLEKLNSCC